MRPIVILLGIGIFVLGLIGARATPWLAWLDAALGVLAIFGGSVRTPVDNRAWVLGPAALGAGALALWIIALATGASIGVAWWTFAFGVGFLLCAAAQPRAPMGGPTSVRR